MHFIRLHRIQILWAWTASLCISWYGGFEQPFITADLYIEVNYRLLLWHTLLFTVKANAGSRRLHHPVHKSVQQTCVFAVLSVAGLVLASRAVLSPPSMNDPALLFSAGSSEVLTHIWGVWFLGATDAGAHVSSEPMPNWYIYLLLMIDAWFQRPWIWSLNICMCENIFDFICVFI